MMTNEGRPAERMVLLLPAVFESRVTAAEMGEGGASAVVDIVDSTLEWVEIHSYDEDTRVHPLIDALVGRRVRVTIEVINEE